MQSNKDGDSFYAFCIEQNCEVIFSAKTYKAIRSGATDEVLTLPLH